MARKIPCFQSVQATLPLSPSSNHVPEISSIQIMSCKPPQPRRILLFQSPALLHTTISRQCRIQSVPRTHIRCALSNPPATNPRSRHSACQPAAPSSSRYPLPAAAAAGATSRATLALVMSWDNAVVQAAAVDVRRSDVPAWPGNPVVPSPLRRAVIQKMTSNAKITRRGEGKRNDRRVCDMSEEGLE